MEASTENTSASSNGSSSQSPWAAHEAGDSVGRPEIPVIGALVGGFVLGRLTRREGR
jgi:hypothetical protein